MFLYLILFVLNNLIIYFLAFNHNKNNFFLDSIKKKHAIHSSKIFKLGGVLIFINLSLFIILEFYSLTAELINIFLFALTITLIGIYEDYKSTDKFTWRLFLILLITTLFIFNEKLLINNLNFGINILDSIYQNNFFLKILVTIFCINTVIHSFNFIDGVNGNLNFYVISILISILIILNLEQLFIDKYKVIIVFIFLLLISIFFFNYPIPLIFMGDGGAYFLGSVISIFLILLSNNISKDQISVWYYGNLMIFPFTEMFISFFRRLFVNKTKPTTADNKHIHHLIFQLIDKKKFFRSKSINYKNSSTALFMLSIYLPTIIFSTLSYNNEILLKIIFFFSFLFFILIYFYLSKLKYK